MKTKIFTIGALILTFLVIVAFNSKPQVAAGAGGLNTTIFAFSDSTEVVGSTTASQLVLATSTGRQYAIIGNNSTSSTMYLSLTGGGAASVNKGVMVPFGQSYEIRDVNLYTGAIYAIFKTNGGAVGSTTVAARQ